MEKKIKEVFDEIDEGGSIGLDDRIDTEVIFYKDLSVSLQR